MIPIYICQLGGLLIICGSIFLLFKERIYIDAATGQVLKIEIPVLGKLSSNTPTLMFILFGIVLLLTPLWFSRTAYLTVTQELDFGSNPPIDVQAYVVTQDKGSSGTSLTVKVPDLPDSDYIPSVVLFTSNGMKIASVSPDRSKAKHGVIDLGKTHIILRPVVDAQTTPPLQAVSLARPKGFGQ